MEFYGSVFIGVELRAEAIKHLSPVPYARWLGVDPSVVQAAWSEDAGYYIGENAAAAYRNALVVCYVDDFVDFCAPGGKTALAIRLADFNHHLRGERAAGEDLDRRLAFSAAEIASVFVMAAAHLTAAGIIGSDQAMRKVDDIMLFVPTTISGT